VLCWYPTFLQGGSEVVQSATKGGVIDQLQGIAEVTGKTGAVLRGLGGRGPHLKVCHLWAPTNEVHHADILTEVYAIALLGLQVQVCQ